MCPVSPRLQLTWALSPSAPCQALEDDLNQKKWEQERFFKLNEEAESLGPPTPNNSTKFFPYSTLDAS